MRPAGQGYGGRIGLRAERDALVAGATTAEGCDAFPALYSAAADAHLQVVLAEAVGGDERGVALVAVGGYGRGELCPGSDLDLVLVHRGRRNADEVAGRVWYPLWDEGLRLDHSVRTAREALAVAREDLRAALGLLDARLVAGDAAVGGDLRGRMHELFRAHGRRYLSELGEAVESRHRGSGEVAFLLEPDLKEAHGGLRDVHALRAAAAALPWLAPSLKLEAAGAAARTLLAVRVALHARTGRPSDRLLLEEQDGVAELLGHDDADQLMAAVSTAGREIAWLSDDGWRRVRSALAGPRGRVSGRDRPLGPGLVLRDGEIVLAAGSDPSGDATLPLRAAAIAAQDGHPFSADLFDRLAASPAPAEPWPIAVLQPFLATLGGGERAVAVLEALDRVRMLERLIPEWTAVRNRPQRNAFHRFTVDRHLLETVARAGDHVRSVARPDLLLVGALLHDIGKGYPGDHTVAGTRLAPVIAARMGFDAEDVETITRLVHCHLLLAEAATGRDLDDPATIESVARAVGDTGTLELLAALTEADSLATGPTAWSTWKATLVADLVRRVATALGDRPESPAPAVGHGAPPVVSVPPELAGRASGGSVEVTLSEHAGTIRVIVVAPDRPGLLACAAGVLTLHGLGVRAAVVGGEPGGAAVERFDVEPLFDRPVDPVRLERDIADVLAGRSDATERIAAQASSYGAAPRRTAARPAEVRVTLDNGASERATVVEVRAPDSHGLLHVLAQVLADQGLDVASARVSTLGHEVVDTFYVRDAREQGSPKLLDPGRLAALEQALRVAAGGAPQAGSPVPPPASESRANGLV